MKRYPGAKAIQQTGNTNTAGVQNTHLSPTPPPNLAVGLLLPTPTGGLPALGLLLLPPPKTVLPAGEDAKLGKKRIESAILASSGSSSSPANRPRFWLGVGAEVGRRGVWKG